MSQYQDYFHLDKEGKQTSLVFGSYTLGTVAAFVLASTLPDQVGRRWCMFVGNAILL
jgi:hypothetical protein